MAIIDRVKERTETDLTDPELQMIIDEANQDIINKFGPHADPGNPISVLLPGNRESIILQRSIDISQTVAIVEYYDWWGETTYNCVASDYRIWPPFNHRIQRRWDGSSALPRRTWGDRVKVTYVPVNDGNMREEVIVKLVVLAIQYDAFTQQTVGDYSGQTGDYKDERNKLLMSIAPRHGMDMA